MPPPDLLHPHTPTRRRGRRAPPGTTPCHDPRFASIPQPALLRRRRCCGDSSRDWRAAPRREASPPPARRTSEPLRPSSKAGRRLWRRPNWPGDWRGRRFARRAKAPCAVVEAATAGRDRVTPRWDRASGGLLWGGVVVKCFRHDAANQAVVLDAFEGRGWPPSVADPLPRRAGLNRKERLRETVRGLNRRLAAGTIRFLSGGSGAKSAGSQSDKRRWICPILHP